MSRRLLVRRSSAVFVMIVSAALVACGGREDLEHRVEHLVSVLEHETNTRISFVSSLRDSVAEIDGDEMVEVREMLNAEIERLKDKTNLYIELAGRRPEFLERIDQLQILEVVDAPYEGRRILFDEQERQ